MTKKEPATIPPNVPCSLQPMYVATCWASGPGRSMQKLSVRRYCCSETQRLFSTNSRCMIAIWPAGPPKLMNPSLTQNRNASPNPTLFCSASLVDVAFTSLAFLGSFGGLARFVRPPHPSGLVPGDREEEGHGYDRHEWFEGLVRLKVLVSRRVGEEHLHRY